MSASVQFMITNAMRATLVEELEFEPEEVDVMRPEIAAELIEKKMKRPFGDSPMPDAWKKDYEGLGAGENSGGGGGGSGIFQPISDLFRSVFYMTLTAGFCLGVAWHPPRRRERGSERRTRTSGATCGGDSRGKSQKAKERHQHADALHCGTRLSRQRVRRWRVTTRRRQRSCRGFFFVFWISIIVAIVHQTPLVRESNLSSLTSRISSPAHLSTALLR